MIQQPHSQFLSDRYARPVRPTGSPLTLSEPGALDMPRLIQRCSAESERFFRGQPHDTRYAYELFRRALVDRDEQAWEQLYLHYSPLVDSWVRRSGAFASSGESSEYFVSAAFTRFWRAISAERFAQFSTLSSLLQYLQRCASCVVIDSVRGQSWAEMRPDDEIPLSLLPQAAPDEEALERVSRNEFWSYIKTQLQDEAEHVVVVSSFVLDMKPTAIAQARPDLFGNVQDVYNVKRNVLGRLGRNPEFRRLAGLPLA